MTLSVGSRIGPYHVSAVLGQGGMGIVYRARDLNLDRDVALKILPAAFVSDANRLARFRREARVLASLNHPNIGTIYGFEESDGVRALVLELVEGPTLADRLTRGGALPTRDALRAARQIAEALEAAHERGVIHRDLKPANIKLRSDGTVKVLDFGIAKVLVSSPGPLEPHAETETMTELGVVIGTMAYMSPEQARGEVVDRRADIWAFGCVIFEMLTATRAFPAGTLTDVRGPTAEPGPDWNALPPDTPAPIRVLLRRCLQADVTERLQHIGDARIEIQDALEHPERAGRSSAPARAAGWRRAAPWIVASLAVVLAIAIALLTRGPAPASRRVVRLELNLPSGVDLDTTVAGQSAAMSPDGTQVAFVGISGGVRQVYVRRLTQFDAVPLRGTEQATSCFFSPDGRRIAFVLPSGSLKTVSVADGAVSTLATQVDYTTGATWGSDDRITYSRQGTLWQVRASGGAPRQLTTLDDAEGELSHAWPAIVDGGRALLFASMTADRPGTSQIEALSLPDGRRRVLVDSGTFPLYAPSGHLVYCRDGVLLAAPFDAARLELTGPAVRVVENLALTAGVPVAAVSAAGSLAFAPGTAASSRLVLVSRTGAEQSLNEAPRGYRHPRLSPNGRRLVVQASGDLWIQDLARGTFTRLTMLGTVDGFMSWMPDGSRIVFRTSTGVQIVDADGSGRSEIIPGTSAADYPNSVSPDGATLVYVKMAETGDLETLSLRGERRAAPLLQTTAYEAGAQFSPDGRWLAYVSDESGQLQVYVQPFPSLDSKTQVSTDGGTQVLWSRSGKELFYRRGNQMMAVDVSTTPQLTLSAPRLLFEQRYAAGTVTFANYDVATDGKHFLMVKEESGAGRLSMVLNWSDELKRLAPPTP